MKTTYYTVHVLENGNWFYKKSYKLNNKYYECGTDIIIDNTKIYNVTDL